MQNFQQILTQAAQLKEHQLKKDRKGYQALPQFLKTGLGFNKKYDILRKQHFLFQYRVSNKIKQQGNAYFKQDKIDEAISKYEQALAIFRYIESRTYENLKDQDLTYHSFSAAQLPPNLLEKYQAHLIALYLNICSCLTKQNKKEDALYSADQALKIKKTVKGHYKKAQVYLKYVNRDANDIKLGILQLKEAYALDKSEDILRQMYAAKEGFQKQKEKSKNWFKFMFDKNKDQKASIQEKQEKENVQSNQQPKIVQNDSKISGSQKKQLQQLQKASEMALKSQEAQQKQKLQQTKQKLKIYLQMDSQKWEQNYQKDFIKRHGSKIYSLLKIYKYEQLAAQFRMLLAKCLQNQESKLNTKQALSKVIEWIKNHSIQKISKYKDRYELQTGWIKQKRQQKQKIKSTNQQQKIISHYKQLYERQYQQQEAKNLSFEQKKLIQQNLSSFQSNNPETKQKNSNQNSKQKGEKIRKKIDREQNQEIRGIRNNLARETGTEDSNKISMEEKRKYIVAGVVLLLVLIRFLFF